MRHSLFIVLLLVLPLATPAQNFDESWRWMHFTTESALPSNNVLDVIETPDSTLWAVCDAGLAWYDGFQWIKIQLADSTSLYNSTISSDYEDDKLVVANASKYYVVSRKGLYDLNVATANTLLVFLSGDTILVDKSHSLFFLKGRVLRPFEASQRLTRGKVKLILRTRAGGVWMTTKEGVSKWDGNDWRLVLSTHGEVPNPIAVAENSNGTALINIEAPPRWSGLWQWSRGSRAARRIPGAPEGIRTVAIDSTGRIAVSCLSGETRFHSGGSWRTSPMLQARSKHVHNLFFRRNGDLVIATTDGIQYFNASSPR